MKLDNGPSEERALKVPDASPMESARTPGSDEAQEIRDRIVKAHVILDEGPGEIAQTGDKKKAESVVDVGAPPPPNGRRIYRPGQSLAQEPDPEKDKREKRWSELIKASFAVLDHMNLGKDPLFMRPKEAIFSTGWISRAFSLRDGKPDPLYLRYLCQLLSEFLGDGEKIPVEVKGRIDLLSSQLDGEYRRQRVLNGYNLEAFKRGKVKSYTWADMDSHGLGYMSRIFTRGGLRNGVNRISIGYCSSIPPFLKWLKSEQGLLGKLHRPPSCLADAFPVDLVGDLLPQVDHGLPDGIETGVLLRSSRPREMSPLPAEKDLDPEQHELRNAIIEGTDLGERLKNLRNKRKKKPT